MKIQGAILASTVLFSCGAPAKRPQDDVAPGKGMIAVAAERSAMKLPVTAITVRGELTAKMSSTGAWMPLIQGASFTQVRELKADRRGAIVALGDAATAPLLYLRANTRVMLSQDGSGVHVAVLEGRARLRHGASVSSYIDTEGGEVIVTGDVLVDGGAKDQAEVIPTGTREAAADWSLALQVPDTGAGVGRMEARISKDRMEPLELKSVDVNVKTAGDLAVTEVTHVFHNAGDERREGTFRFPVPDGAMLIGLAMEIDGKLVEGEVVEREKARQVYEKIVDEMLDPALLEWEEGNWFKLRVFPLDANADKKVVIRYVTPLSKAGNAWEYGYSISAPDRGAIGSVTVKVDGQLAMSQRGVAQGIDVIVPVAGAKVPTVMREQRADGIYTAIRIAPAIPASATATMPGNRKVAIVFDTSRSSLEGRAQALELLQSTLRELAPEDRFMVLASDIEATAGTPDFVAPTPDAIAQAVAFITAIEPDGASDLGAALHALSERAATDVIYVGDGIPTWGEQRPEELAKLADTLHAPIDAALIGKGATTSLWSELAGRTGGRAMIVKSQLDERRFALAATHAEAARLTETRVIGPKDAIMFPQAAATVFAGDELIAVMKTPIDQPMPASVRLTGKLGGKEISQEISLTPAVATDRVAQRWARQQLAMLEATDAPKDDIVKLSTDLGVMSKYTSLLVLENDEAYKRFQIERKNAEAQAKEQALAQAPQVTGGDLDTLGARQASLSPDEIQPGDPEIKIPAPQDARSVVVSLPFGETKLAVWDEEQAAWMVRFLIDQATADGEYAVRVTITHADGHIEVIKLPYTVDTKAPTVKITATKDATGYQLVARQQANGARKDADRVEVLLPDGAILRLTQVAWGKFEGHWDTAMLSGPVTLRIVARDPALNQSTSELVVK
jgi:hypothetical protein